VIADRANRSSLAAFLQQLGFELRRLRGGEPREDIPVLDRDERVDLGLAIAHQFQRNRLHAAGTQTAAHLVPQQRADFVADQPIEHAARTLRVDHLLVDRARMFQRVLHRLLGNLVERQPVELALLAFEFLDQMPANRLTFAIRVGCDVDF
jgi:hypothetical protein